MIGGQSNGQFRCIDVDNESHATAGQRSHKSLYKLVVSCEIDE